MKSLPRIALACALPALSLGLAACKEQHGSGGGTLTDAPRGSAEAEAPPRPPSPEEQALVTKLLPDNKLEDFAVREVHGADHSPLEIVCVKDAARVVLSIARSVEGGPAAPASAGPYAVFYSVRGTGSDEGERLAKALAKRLEANLSAPVPAGLGPFVVRPMSL
jgi:hypothetical protein